MIKLVLVSGFLGAGKTTLMQQILSNYSDKKVGVIVNEFGEVNIDARLISREGVQMAELSNGSIFCACIKDKFVDSLIELSMRELDYLFIEASGLADPANMEQILEGIKNKVLNPYSYRGSVCVLDGESFSDLYELLPAIGSQLEFSGAVIVNKGDLIDEEQLGEILEIVKEVNPTATVFVTSYCKVNIEELVEGVRRREIAERETSNTYESRPVTFVVKGVDTLPIEGLKAFLEDIASDTYRIKGFAKTDQGDREISAVGTSIHLNQWDDGVDKTEIVVISSIGFKMMSVITRAIDKNLKGYVRL